MSVLSSLRIAVLAATAALIAAGAQAGPMPTNVAAMKSMVDKTTTEVRWGGGWRGGGWGYRGGFGYRGWGYRGLGYGVAAGALVGGAIASRGYYGGYGGYGISSAYGGFGGYYSYAASTITTPGYYTTDNKYFLEAKMFDLKTDELLLSIQSKADNPSGLEKSSKLYTQTLMDEIKLLNLNRK